MSDFFSYYFLSVASAEPEKRKIMILGLIMGLKVQFALLKKGQIIYTGFWQTELRKNFGKPIGSIIKQSFDAELKVLETEMFAGWKELTNDVDLNVYLLKASVGALQVVRSYGTLVKSNQYDSYSAMLAVEKIVRSLIDFLEKEFRV